MDIAALSIGLSQMKVTQQVGASVMKMAMESSQVQIDDLMQVMEQSVQPHVGRNINIKL